MMVAKFKEFSSLPSIHGVVDVTQIHTQQMPICINSKAYLACNYKLLLTHGKKIKMFS